MHASEWTGRLPVSGGTFASMGANRPACILHSVQNMQTDAYVAGSR